MTSGTSTIRLGFNARLLQFPQTRGWNRYAVELLIELPAVGVEPILYSDGPIHPDHLVRLGELSDSVQVIPKKPYLAWEQIWLPRACWRDRVDVFHSPYHFGLPFFSPCPRVLTLHDAIDRAFGEGRKGDFRSRFHQWVARTRADRIITVSAHAQDDLDKFLGVHPSRVAVIPEAADARFFQAPSDLDRARARALVGRDGRYLFYIGGWEHRKNLPLLIGGFADARVEDLTLVLAGGKSDQRDEMAKRVALLGVQDRIQMLGYVPDSELPALYAEALAFIYPSSYEGFGLQLCEAMAAGCPTLAARATSLPEVLGEGGATFSIDSADELAALIRRVASEGAFRDALKRNARARASNFTWQKTASMTADVYRSVIDRS